MYLQRMRIPEWKAKLYDKWFVRLCGISSVAGNVWRICAYLTIILGVLSLFGHMSIAWPTVSILSMVFFMLVELALDHHARILYRMSLTNVILDFAQEIDNVEMEELYDMIDSGEITGLTKEDIRRCYSMDVECQDPYLLGLEEKLSIHINKRIAEGSWPLEKKMEGKLHKIHQFLHNSNN